jgi:integrase/recombinase XerC
MSVRSGLVRKIVRGGKPRLVIDIQYRDRDGRLQRYRRDATLQTAAGARAEAERLYLLAVSTGSVEGQGLRPCLTFRAFVEGMFTRLYMPRYRPATRVRYEALLKQGVLDAFGSQRLDRIDTPGLRAFVAELLERKVQARGPLNFVRTVLSAALDAGALEALPTFPRIRRQGRKLPDAPSDEEVRAMLAHAGGWLRTAIALAALAGLRMGEVRALEVRDVDLTGARLLVRRALSEDEVLPPKSGHERVVPLAPELKELVVESLRDKLPTARVVVNERGGTPGRTHVLARLKSLQRRHGLPERSFHALRHYFCSTLVRRGASLEAVRLLAGHGDLQTTQRYVHAAGGDLRAAIAKLSGN